MKEEIAPGRVRGGGRETVIAEDNPRRRDTPVGGLARLPPAFQGQGYVTAGNASGIVDGAAAVVVASPAAAPGVKTKPLGRVITYGVAGVPPRIMGIGPVPAIRMALERAGLRLQEIDLFEINEAFAAQYLAVEKELGLDRARVNVNGGAGGLGPPPRATRTRLGPAPLLALRRRGGPHRIPRARNRGRQGVAGPVEGAP